MTKRARVPKGSPKTLFLVGISTSIVSASNCQTLQLAVFNTVFGGLFMQFLIDQNELSVVSEK